MDLEGEVTLTSKEGYLVKTEKAHVNIDSKIIEGDGYVEGAGPTGEIMGTNGFKVESRDKGNFRVL